MNIQGIGQTYTAYASMNMRGTSQGNGEFDPSSIDSNKIMEKEDANLDGILTADETRMSEDMFSNADTNSDGELTAEELEEILASGPPMMGGGMGPMGGPGPIDAASILEQEDTDGDGSISAEETRLSDTLFSELDTNQDGLISQEELEQSVAQKQEEMNSSQGYSSNQTVTQETAINAYHKAMETFMTELTGGEYTDSNLSSFLSTIA